MSMKIPRKVYNYIRKERIGLTFWRGNNSSAQMWSNGFVPLDLKVGAHYQE